MVWWVMLLVLLLVGPLRAGGTGGLGDFTYMLPKSSSALLTKLDSTPLAPAKTRASIADNNDGSSIDETHRFEVPLDVTSVPLFAQLLAGEGAGLRLLRQRLKSETTRVSRTYKIWLSRDVVVVSLKVALGWRTFVLRREGENEWDGEEEEEDRKTAQDVTGACQRVSFSVADLQQQRGPARCTLQTRIALHCPLPSASAVASSLPPSDKNKADKRESRRGDKATRPRALVSLRCTSAHLPKSLRKRLLAALQEAWADRVRSDVLLCLARMQSAEDNARVAAAAQLGQRQAALDKVHPAGTHPRGRGAFSPARIFPSDPAAPNSSSPSSLLPSLPPSLSHRCSTQGRPSVRRCGAPAAAAG